MVLEAVPPMATASVVPPSSTFRRLSIEFGVSDRCRSILRFMANPLTLPRKSDAPAGVRLRGEVWSRGDGTAEAPSPCRACSVSARHWEADAFLGERVAHPLEPLVVRERDRSRIGLALELARRILHVGVHQLFDVFADRHHYPGALGVAIHQDIIALLRVLPEVEHLRRGSHVFFSALPAEIGIDSQAAG